MGKIRIKTIGIDDLEEEQKRKSKARREGKKAQLRKKQQAASADSYGEPRAASAEGSSEPKAAAVQDSGPEKGSRRDEPKAPMGPVDDKKDKLQDTVAKTGSARTKSEKSDKTEATSDKKKKAKRKKKLRSKRYQDALKQIDRAKLYPISDALALIKKTSLTRFDGTIESHIVLDPKVLKEKGAKGKKTKPSLRGTVSFPHGTGKQVKVAIADDVLIATISEGTIDFDILVAAPEMMPKLVKVAKVLGPKGLMPNPKTGTIGKDPEKIAEKLSKGQVSFKTEPENPIVHIAIGKVSFEDKKLLENLSALTKEIGTAKIIRMTLSATMGPGIKVNTTSL